MRGRRSAAVRSPRSPARAAPSPHGGGPPTRPRRPVSARARLVALALVAAASFATGRTLSGLENGRAGPGWIAVTAGTPGDGLLQAPLVGHPVMLPVLNFQGTSDICRTWVAVQNAGDVATKVVLVAFQEPSAPGKSNGPLKAECSGLIKPRGSWDFLGAQIPTGAFAGLLYSFSTQTFGELGITDRPDEVVADAMCADLFERVAGHAAAFQGFHAAYLAGGTYEGLPMERLVGAPITAAVHRDCPGDVVPGAEVASTYHGHGVQDQPRNGDGLVDTRIFPLVAREMAPASPWVSAHDVVYVQNAGGVTATVKVDFSPAGSAASWSPCATVDALAPGESTPVALPEGCMAPGTTYVARILSDTPVVVVADRPMRDTLTTIEGWPPGPPTDASGVPGTGPADGSYGPFVPPPAEWRSTLWLHNAGTAAQSPTVTWFDGAGNTAARSSPLLCAGCLVAVPLASDTWQGAEGSVQVAKAPGALVAAVLRAERGPDFAAPSAGITYALVPSELAQLNDGDELLLPHTPRDLNGTGVTTVLELASHTPSAGKLGVEIGYWDANDLTAVECVSVPGLGTARLSLQDVLWDGVLGAAVVRLTSVQGGGPAVLTAAALNSVGTLPALDVPGDELTLTVADALPGGATAPIGCDPPYRQPPRPDPTAELPHAAAMRAAFRLPILHFLGQNDVCTAAVRIENAASTAGKAILVAWSEPGFCQPQCAGPLAVQCSGLLTPGGDWIFEGQGVVPGAKSAVLYAVNARTLDDLGVEPGNPQLAADRLCQEMFERMVGDCEESRRFEQAWAEGASWAGLPLGQLVAPGMSGRVTRTCPDSGMPGQSLTAEYDAVSADRFDPFAATEGSFVQSLIPVYGDFADARTILYVQNGGLRCTSVRLSFHTDGDWDDVRECFLLVLSPGETFQFDTLDCVGPDFNGSVVLRSEEPLALVADAVAPGVLRTVQGRASWSPFDLDGDGIVDERDVARLEAALGSAPGDAAWDPAADLNGDGAVNDIDRAILLRNLPGPVPSPSPSPSASPTGAPGPRPTPTTGTPGWPVFLPFGETHHVPGRAGIRGNRSGRRVR